MSFALKTIVRCAAFALCFDSVAAQAQSAPSAVAIEELMSAREFATAGLQKLTQTELQALNVWLARYATSLAQNAARASAQAPRPAPTPEVIETQIDDDFEGWEGETIFKLRNGQIWQQSSYAYTYHYAYAPKVLIYRSGGVYKMKVDGVSGEISVRRLK